MTGLAIELYVNHPIAVVVCTLLFSLTLLAVSEWLLRR